MRMRVPPACAWWRRPASMPFRPRARWARSVYPARRWYGGDTSGLAAPADWQALCAEAAVLDPSQAAAFFRDRFDWVVVGKGEAFATGYYEPEIRGSRTPWRAISTPIYRIPPDLIRAARRWPDRARADRSMSGQCVLYFTRAEIEDGALAGRGLEIGWAADPIDLFFLQIQGRAGCPA